MTRIPPLPSRSSVALTAKIFVVPVLVLAVVAGVCIAFETPSYLFFRDPAAIAGVSPFVGLVSNVGVLLWASAGSVTLFAAMVLGGRPGFGRMRGFLAYASALSFVLMADDLFMLHETLGRSFGMRDELLVAAYAVAGLIWLGLYRRIVVQTEYAVLLAGLGLLAASVGVDIVQGPLQGILGSWRIFLEDGCKFLGIFGWTSYLVLTAFRQIETSSEKGDTPN